MITSAENRAWPEDVPFGDTYAKAGLPARSLIRPCKLATIEISHAEKLGRVNRNLMDKVTDFLLRSLRS